MLRVHQGEFRVLVQVPNNTTSRGDRILSNLWICFGPYLMKSSALWQIRTVEDGGITRK